MFVSPCSLRSTQCAALIALAAAAGIARVDVERTFSASGMDGVGRRTASTPAATHHVGASVGGFGFFELTKTSTTPWLHQVAAFAAWLFNPATSAAGSDTRNAGGATNNCPMESAAELAALAPPLPQESAVVYFDRPCAALCTHSHLLPFAVGPPLSGANSTPNAAGTSVPGDSAANGASVLSVSRVVPLAKISPDARLARLVCPSLDLAGRYSKNYFRHARRAGIFALACRNLRTRLPINHRASPNHDLTHLHF